MSASEALECHRGVATTDAGKYGLYTPTNEEGVDWRAVTPCSTGGQRSVEKRGNCGADWGRAEIYSGIVEDWRLLLIKHTRLSRQVVEGGGFYRLKNKL